MNAALRWLFAGSVLLVEGVAIGGPARVIPPILPVEVFFSADTVQQPMLSPTGRYLAWCQSVHDRANLVALDRQTGRKIRLTDLKGDFVSEFHWATPERLIIKRQFLDGSGFSTYAVNADGSQFVELQKADQLESARNFIVIDPRAADGKHVLVAMERRLAARNEPYALDIFTGKATKLFGNTVDVHRWITDRQGVIRIGVAADRVSGETVVYYRPDNAGDWSEIERFPSYGSAWDPLGFDGDNRTLWVRTNRGRDTSAVVTYDPIRKQQIKEVLADPTYDAGDIIYSRHPGAVIGVSIAREGWETQWLDQASRQLMAALDQALPDTRNTIVSRSDDDAALLILAQSDRDLGSYYLFDNHDGSLTRLFGRNDRIVPSQMAPMKPMTIVARDGLELHGFLTLPIGREARRLPLVLIPHDGLFDERDYWGFDREVQFLANRGYAVLRVNYRGSTGYGTRFLESGYQQWGLKMQDDLTDAVRQVVAQGQCDPRRVAIYGQYYGGFAALCGLTSTPDLFACAIARTAPVDLREISVMQQLSRANVSYQNYVARAWGHPARDEARLKAASPIYAVSQIRAPLMVAYRKFDPDRPLVIYDAYLRLEKEMRKNGKDLKTVFIENQPPGYNALENWFGFYRDMDAFLAQNLDLKAAK